MLLHTPYAKTSAGTPFSALSILKKRVERLDSRTAFYALGKLASKRQSR
jgi:hypothetical protein